MPVEGFPTTLECLLNAVLRDNTVSSFKIDGRGSQTTVVLRLTTNTSFHHPETADSSVTYRRKCPSQVSRDRRRAEAYRADREKKASVSSPSGLFMPTPPSLCHVADQRTPSPAVTDFSPFVPCTSSASLSGDNQQGKSQINIPSCDMDTQTVTISSDIETVCDIDEEMSCKWEGSDDGEQGGGSVSDLVVNHSDVDCDVDCKNDSEHSKNVTESENTGAKSELTYSNVLKCFERFNDNINKQMDHVSHELKEIVAITKTCSSGIPFKDVS